MNKFIDKYRKWGLSQKIFSLIIVSYFLLFTSIFFTNNYFLMGIFFQIMIFIYLLKIIQKQLPLPIFLKSKPLRKPLIYAFYILFLNILLVSSLSNIEETNTNLKYMFLASIHFILFLYFFIKLMAFYNNKKSVTAIFGAGVAGQQLYQELSTNGEYNVLFFIDDSPDIHSNVEGLNVFNRKYFIEKLYKSVDFVYIAIPTITSKQLNSLVLSIEGLGVGVKKLPALKDIPSKKASIEILSSIDEADLVGRQTVLPNIELIQKNIKNKVVLVSGAGGSIGGAICQEVIKHAPKEIVMFDVSEFGLYNTNRILNDNFQNNLKIRISPEIGSIQSLYRIKQLFKTYSIDTVFHAAAYKHVPLVEQNLAEGFKNNVLGTKNLIATAVENKVKNFVLISSDKAVRPTNFMGVTKRLCELLCQSYSKNNKDTIISMVRFGNVLGSSGSVVPLFKDQINNGGPLTVTHPDISRYFMTVEEAAELVIQASGLAKGGEIFVLDMGKQIKILKLAKRMIALAGKRPCYNINEQSEGDILIEFTGLRPGEKMYEELFIEESFLKTSHPQINKCDHNFVEIEHLEMIFKKLLKALDEGESPEMLKEIVNNLPVSYDPQN